ncbi:serine protease inhibitor I/II [Dendroctonus ponderosae]|uniref:Pacifastin domain-containing protein n=1 Tax=Dendroctonus ponderosae TaxID=77166 RepID=A0AAR5QDX7_DENPD|nr:serine protease inhibitor I/II [Dendroctonus ponderosae]KAH1016843.1 hypothetical protein HUJ04_008011 [Dendroctonus ponderosae]KAH1026263.1 hypothetical protein HUJ05_010807 [Dendroctonus ponderosae]
MNTHILFCLVLVVAAAESAKLPEKQCKPGDVKMEDCNRCFCAAGLWACTRIGCLQDVQQPAVANKIKKRNVVTPKDANEPCKDGDITSFDNNCNMCTCSNGLWACTLKFCL